MPQHEDQRDNDAKKKTGCYAHWSIRAGFQGPTGDLLELLPACSFRQPPERDWLYTHTHWRYPCILVCMCAYIYECVKNRSHILCLSLNAWLDLLLLNTFDQGHEMGHLQQRKREQMKCVDTIRCGSGHDKHLFTFIRRCKVSGETKGASIKSPGILRTKWWEEQKNGFTTIPAKLMEPLGYPHREMKQKSGREGQQDGAMGKSGCSTDDLSLISRTHKVEGEN